LDTTKAHTSTIENRTALHQPTGVELFRQRHKSARVERGEGIKRINWERWIVIGTKLSRDTGLWPVQSSSHGPEARVMGKRLPQSGDPMQSAASTHFRIDQRESRRAGVALCACAGRAPRAGG